MGSDYNDILVKVTHVAYNQEMGIPLNDWIRSGPGLSGQTIPIGAESRKDGSQLSIATIPLRYRHNSLSFFLIATQIIDQPWNYEGQIPIHYAKPERLDANILRSPSGVDFLLEETESSQLNLERAGIGIRFQLPDDWGKYLYSIGTDIKAVVTSIPIDSRKQLKLGDMDNDFICSIDLRLTATADPLLERYLPSKDFSSSWQHQTTIVNGYETHYFAAPSQKYDCQLTVILLKIKSMIPEADLGAFFIEVFCISRLSSQMDLLNQYLNLLSIADIQLSE